MWWCTFKVWSLYNPLPVYRNRWICVYLFILDPATLLRSFISSGRGFLVHLGDFPPDNPLSSANREFYFSFLIYIPVISFSYFIKVAGTSSTVLNESGGNGHPYLVPNFGRKAFSYLGCMVLGLAATSCSRGSLKASQQMTAATIV